MQLEFKTRRLERAFVQSSRATREWGAVIGRRYVERLVFIQAAGTVADLRAAWSLRFHGLTGVREGQYAVTLTGNWRLVLSLPDGEAGRRIRVEEVTDYHGR